MNDAHVLHPAARRSNPTTPIWRSAVAALVRGMGVAAIAVPLALAWNGTQAADRDKEEAARFLHDLTGRAETMLFNETMTADQRRSQLANLIKTSFDLDAMSRFVLAKHWNSTTLREREEFRTLFRDYVFLTIGRHIASVPRFSLDVVAMRRLGENAVAIRSNLAFGEKRREVVIDWRLRRNDGIWRVADMIVQGISFAAVIRSEFVAVIDSHNGEIEGLLAELRKKSTRYQAASG